jgi:predicted RNase H-like nuclease (RuvC/YqgF family)
MTEDNLALDIPIETLFKYLLKDYHRERQRTLYLEGQIKSVLKRNAYLEQEIGKVKQQLLKKIERSEKQIDYSQEIRLHQAVSCRNNTIEQLRNENARLKNELDTYMLFLGKI